jgi:hypothetical protein
MIESGGVDGRPEDLTHYFERVLAAVPGKIEFEFLGVFHGVDTLVVHFQSKTTRAPSSWK